MVAAPPPMRARLQSLRRGEHSRGLGLCPACRIQPCPQCGEKSLHLVGDFGFSEEVCENGCNSLTRSGFVVGFQADMKEALYQLERREARRRRRKH